MGAGSSEKTSSFKSRTFSKSFEEALSHLKTATGVAVRTGALAGMLAIGPGAGFLGCAVNDGIENQDPLLHMGAADGWLDNEAIRDTNMVTYIGDSWSEYYDCNTRGGCMGVALFLKVAIQPVAGANLDDKRVGVVYSAPGGETQTATGDFFTTYDDGREEWHIRLDMRSYDPGVIRLDAWYQDGLGNTYMDDNNGEGHVDSYRGTHSVIYHYQDYSNPVRVDENGVFGRINLNVADLDYDKDIRMVWTTDNWATANVARMGNNGEANVVYWIEDTWSGTERWAIDLDIDGPIEQFTYAFVYRHGGANCPENEGAEGCYEFWDNNRGNNYTIYQGTSYR